MIREHFGATHAIVQQIPTPTLQLDPTIPPKHPSYRFAQADCSIAVHSLVYSRGAVDLWSSGKMEARIRGASQRQCLTESSEGGLGVSILVVRCSDCRGQDSVV